MEDFYRRLNVFIDSVNYELTDNEQLIEMRKYAEENRVPIIRENTAKFLYTVLKLGKFDKMLEVGTAIAYSSIFFSHTCPQMDITTIEVFEPRIVEAEKNIKLANKEDRIHLIKGDAEEVVKELCEKNSSYNIIFMDAAKAQYINILPYCKKMLEKGGLLIADNILQDGTIMESRYAVERRDRTIHTRLREFIKAIMDDKDFVSSIIPVGDGLSISYLK